MPRVICDLPNASDEISGVKFHPLEDGGLISDEIDQETADYFASIAGYSLDDDSAPSAAPAATQAPAARKGGKKAPVQPASEPEQPAAAATAAPDAAPTDTVF
jgi:hypothetical protein